MFLVGQLWLVSVVVTKNGHVAFAGAEHGGMECG
jgi:hypothetical protein